MFKQYSKVLLFVGLVFSFIGCHIKEPFLDCLSGDHLYNEIEEPLLSLEFPAYGYARFNPNNSDEIIFRADLFDLVKYNLRTGEKTTIYQGSFSQYSRWNKNDWILLNIRDDSGRFGYNIYKIRSNGEELTPLTTSGNCHNPVWYNTDDKFIYQSYSKSQQWFFADENGQVIDTLSSGSLAASSWQHDSLMASANMDGLIVYNPFNPEYWRYKVKGNGQSRNGAVWLDNERVLWCHTTGIYLTNVVTWSTEVIKETCNGDTYQLPTYAADIDKVIFQRVERLKKASKPRGTIRTSFYMMNPDGTEGKTIEIP